MLDQYKCNHCRQVVVIFTAALGNQVLSSKKLAFMPDKNCLECERGHSSSLELSLALTFLRVASLDVSCNADDRQCVDAHEAKEQREEAVHLERHRPWG